MSVSSEPTARGGKRRIVRFGLILVGILVVSLCVLMGVAFAVTESRLSQSFAVEPVPLAVNPTPDLVERGRELATFRGCRDCHGENLAGRVVADAMPVMLLAAPNITPAGVVGSYSDEDWARTIRHGVKPDKTPVRFMPSYEYTALSHGDLAAIIAYAKSVPAVKASAAKFDVGPVGRVLYLAGELPLIPAEMIDHGTVQPADPQRGPTVDYGAYLITACVGCHGAELSGGPIPGVPPDWPVAANLTKHDTGLGAWSFEDFRTFFRDGGKRPDGTHAQAQYMPVKLVAESSTDDDLVALWSYLQSVPGKPAGHR